MHTLVTPLATPTAARLPVRRQPTYMAAASVATLLLPIVATFLLAQTTSGEGRGEAAANMTAVAFAMLCWLAAGWLVVMRAFGRKFYALMTAALLLKMAINFLHFYFVFAPVAGIASAADVPYAAFSGDSGRIFLSAVTFYETLANHGFWFATLGDYYRGINNPGIAIIFGGLFAVFGEYATVGIPFIVLYSTFAALMFGLIGRSMGISFRDAKLSVLLVMFMPGFVVFPPLYRDNLIMFMLALSAYTAILLPRRSVALFGAVLLLQAILLFSLRSVYLLLPPVFGLMALYMESQTRRRFARRAALFGVVLAAATYAGWSYFSLYLDLFAARFASAATSELSDFAALAPFKALGPVAFYTAGALFSLLAPMPWWQAVHPSLLAYQVFAYAQTWWALTIMVGLFLAWRHRLIARTEGLLLLYFAVVFGLAVLGSLNFQASYFQIAMPLLLLASLRYVTVRWRHCLLISTAIVSSAHVLLLMVQFRTPFS